MKHFAGADGGATKNPSRRNRCEPRLGRITIQRLAPECDSETLTTQLYCAKSPQVTGQRGDRKGVRNRFREGEQKRFLTRMALELL